MSEQQFLVHSSAGDSARQVSGAVRPGVKVLIRAAEAVPDVPELFAKCVAGGYGYDAIDKRILEECKKHDKKTWGKKYSALTPKNTPFFRVAGLDFTDPENAARIMEAYGEDRKDGNGRQLYTFPIVFSSNDIFSVHTQEFVAWKGAKRHRWSEMRGLDGEGNLLMDCMTLEEIDPKKDKRAKRRRFGPRKGKKVGECDPNACELYGAAECGLSAALFFHIPKVETMGSIRMSFTSLYAASEIGATLGEISSPESLRRISGVFQGKPIFWLAKRLRDVSKIDPETGQPSKVKQHIICLEARIDLSKVMIAQEEQAMLGAGAIAAPVAEIPETVPSEPPASDSEAKEEPPAAEPPEQEQDYEDAAADEPQGAAAPEMTAEAIYAEIHKGLEKLGETEEQFRKWATAKWGEEWSLEDETLGTALDIVAAAAEAGDVNAFKTRF